MGGKIIKKVRYIDNGTVVGWRRGRVERRGKDNPRHGLRHRLCHQGEGSALSAHMKKIAIDVSKIPWGGVSPPRAVRLPIEFC